MDYQAEPLSRWSKEAIDRGLFEAHWREVGVNRDVKILDPNWESLFGLERAQALCAYTVRKGGLLAGYAVFIATPTLHYKTWVTAYADVVYVVPEARREGVGAKLIEFCKRELMARGVDEIVYHFKPDHDQAVLMKHTGHDLYEHMYHIVLRTQSYERVKFLRPEEEA